MTDEDWRENGHDERATDLSALSVIGTRPEFVMAFPLSRRLRASHDGVLLHTGQHYDAELSEVFVTELGLPEPEYDLDGAVEGAGLDWADVVRTIRTVIEEESPDVVVVFGDTNSTLAGAVAGAETTVPLAHVEAGLRSGDPGMAEERNRVLVDHLADMRFAPTPTAREHLEDEGLGANTHLVGDLLADAVTLTRNVARMRSTAPSDIGVEPGEFVLATVHRAENTDDRTRLGAIVEGLAGSPRPVVLPLHPRTAERLEAYGLYEAAKRTLHLVEPQGYLDFVRLLDAAERVATDSGGVQTEASYLETPCITLREETEWPETVERGHNELVGADATAIQRALRRNSAEITDATNGDDDGVAARIVDVLLEQYTRTSVGRTPDVS